MQEINLLQNRRKDRHSIGEKQKTWLAVILIGFLLLEGAGTGLFMVLSKAKQKSAVIMQGKLVSLQKEINDEQKNLTDSKAFQAQMKNLKFLVSSHIYFSPFFKELSNKTYNKVQYSSLTVDRTTGKVHIEGKTSSYTDIGKFILGLNTSGKFKDIKLLAATPTEGEVFGFNLSLDLFLKPEIFNK